MLPLMNQAISLIKEMYMPDKTNAEKRAEVRPKGSKHNKRIEQTKQEYESRAKNSINWKVDFDINH